MQQPLTPAQLVALNGRNQTNNLAQMRMLMGLNNRPFQPDLSGITDVGSGIAKGVQNLFGGLAQQRQQNQMMGLMADMQAQEEAQARAVAEQQAAAQQARFNAVNDFVNPMQLQPSQYQGAPLAPAMAPVRQMNIPENVVQLMASDSNLLNPYIQARVNPIGMNQVATQLNSDPNFLRNATTVTPAQINAYNVGFGKAPTTVNDVVQANLKTTTDTINANNLPQKLRDEAALSGEQLKGAQLSNQGKQIENQFAPTIKQLQIDNEKLSAENKTLNNAELQDKIKNNQAAIKFMNDVYNNNYDFNNPSRNQQIEMILQGYGVNYKVGDSNAKGPKVDTKMYGGNLAAINVTMPDGTTVIYDKNGNVIQTIPPNGVIQLSPKK